MALTKPSPAMAPPTLGTEVSATGASVTFTGIPAGTRMIIVQFVGVSNNGTADFLVQIGDSGGLETTSYNAAASIIIGTNLTATAAFSTGFAVWQSDATGVVHGNLVLTLEDSSDNTWTAHGVLVRAAGLTLQSAGSKALSETLTQVAILAGGTSSFDAGSFNILYL